MRQGRRCVSRLLVVAAAVAALAACGSSSGGDAGADGAAIDATAIVIDAPPGAPDACGVHETCNGLDDDCDSIIDDDACPEAGDLCHDMECIFPCTAGSCPTGYFCATLPEGMYCLHVMP